MDENKICGPLHGRRIALPETREAERLALMLQEQGAETQAARATFIAQVRARIACI